MRTPMINNASFSGEFVAANQNSGSDKAAKPGISIVLPGYNESAIVLKNLARLCDFMRGIESCYQWEVIFINDGSTDGTGELVESFSKSQENIRILHQTENRGIGDAFRLAFEQCRGDYVVTLDLDLSYSPEHILRLVEYLRETGAEMVVASPYMEGGRTSNVPAVRRVLSIWANRFLSIMARRQLSTLTGMVRAYKATFIKSVDLRSSGMRINTELVYKAYLIGAKVGEIPAHLDWTFCKAVGRRTRSSMFDMRLMRQILSVLISGFLFRPVMFFIIPGITLLLFSMYANIWAMAHWYEQFQNLPQYTWLFSRASAAAATAYSMFPHTFIIGGVSLMLAIQLISLGILSLQSKNHFEEIYHLGSAHYRMSRNARSGRTEGFNGIS